MGGMWDPRPAKVVFGLAGVVSSTALEGFWKWGRWEERGEGSRDARLEKGERQTLHFPSFVTGSETSLFWQERWIPLSEQEQMPTSTSSSSPPFPQM